MFNIIKPLSVSVATTVSDKLLSIILISVMSCSRNTSLTWISVIGDNMGSSSEFGSNG